MKFSAVKLNKKNVNFIFLRHGFACHNAASLLYKNGFKEAKDLIKKDPELTDVGVDATIHNGCIIANILKDNGIDKIHIVGSSPLIRSMETAYYITSKWKTPPSQIYVFPFLREIDESTISNKTAQENRVAQYNNLNHLKPKNSANSRKRIDTITAYAMKSIPEQQAYLEGTTFENRLNFTYVKNSLREEPGDIYSFIDWFHRNSIESVVKNTNDTINVLVITHAGVLLDFYLTQTDQIQEFPNNAGFILKTSFTMLNFELGHPEVIELPLNFYTNYSIANTTDYYCPSNRCNFCTHLKYNVNTKRKIHPVLDPFDTFSCGNFNDTDHKF